MESFWRRVGVEIELATQNGGFASRVGWAWPPLPSDAKTKVCVKRILCMPYFDFVLGMGCACSPLAATQNHGFVSWAWGCLPPHGCDAKPWLCVAV